MKKTVTKSFPLGNRTAPSLDTWKHLFKTVRIFFEQRPWDFLENKDLIAVTDPVSGQTGYCCIMGGGGIEYGMQVYIGDDGLRVFYKSLLGDSDPNEMLQELRCVGFTFGTKDFLEARDLAPIKKLLLPFRGEGWPLFRSCNPGYFPWFITEEEACFLLCCMEQVLCVADEAAMNSDLVINEGPEGNILARVPESSAGDLQWKTEYRQQTVSDDAPVPEYKADEFTVAALARKPAAKDAFWEVDSLSMPTPIMDTEPPRIPRVFLCVESTAGFALGHELSTPGQDYLKMAGEKLTELLRTQKQKPAEIHFCKSQLVESLCSFLESVGVKPVFVETLTILAELKEGMNQRLSKGK